jgi:pimeloyl-ACP methyl ester carboxylesterase
VPGLRFILIWLFGCAATIAYEPVRPGDYACTYMSPIDGSMQPYHVYVPTSYNPEAAAPAAFFLHGFGGRTRPLGHGRRKAWADRTGWVLVAPDGRGSQNWDYIGEDDIFLVLEDLSRTTLEHPALNVDQQRLYAEGCSMGGHGCFRLATRHPDVFAATAPAAGWTSYFEFYPHWYDTDESPGMPEYVDPARRPLLETASALGQTANALWSPVYVTYDLYDRVNPSINAEAFVARLRRIGNVRVQVNEGLGRHCRSYDAVDNYRFFFGKQRQKSPKSLTLTTNTLRYNHTWWLTLDRLIYQNRWARIDVMVDNGNNLRVRTGNALQFRLALTDELVDMSRCVRIFIDDHEPFRVRPEAGLVLRAQLDERHRVIGWSRIEAGEATGKTHQLSGPIAEAFRSRFVIIYGARKGHDTGNPDWVAAQRLAADWNAWMTLHWSDRDAEVTADRPWWMQPYPFAEGEHVARKQPLVTPLPDSQFTLANLPYEANWILVGDPSSNWIVDQLAGHLPLRLRRDAGTPAIEVADQVYSGSELGYFFIAANPLVPERYVAVARGYLSSGISPDDGVSNLGKDLEGLPFYWPDYVVWDQSRKPGSTVQEPFRYLPDTFLAAGFFDSNWRLDTTPPVSRLSLTGRRLGRKRIASPLEVSIHARDAPGGFGVQKIEFQIDDGAWQDYREPFELAADGIVLLRTRATDRCGRYVYRTVDGVNRGYAAAGNSEKPRSYRFNIRKQ